MSRRSRIGPRPAIGQLTMASLIALLADCETAIAHAACRDSAALDRVASLCHAVAGAVSGVHRRFGLWAPSLPDTPRTGAGVLQRFQQIAGSIRRTIDHESLAGEAERLHFALDLSVCLTVFLCAIRRQG